MQKFRSSQRACSVTKQLTETKCMRALGRRGRQNPLICCCLSLFLICVLVLFLFRYILQCVCVCVEHIENIRVFMSFKTIEKEPLPSHIEIKDWSKMILSQNILNNVYKWVNFLVMPCFFSSTRKSIWFCLWPIQKTCITHKNERKKGYYRNNDKEREKKWYQNGQRAKCEHTLSYESIFETEWLLSWQSCMFKYDCCYLLLFLNPAISLSLYKLLVFFFL